MNKGKPSGFRADTKTGAVVRTTAYERSGTAGAGPEWTELQKQEESAQVLHPAGDGGPNQNAGGPNHQGGEAHEDRNP